MSLFLLVGYLGLNKEKEEINTGLTSQRTMNSNHEAPPTHAEIKIQHNIIQ